MTYEFSFDITDNWNCLVQFELSLNHSPICHLSSISLILPFIECKCHPLIAPVRANELFVGRLLTKTYFQPLSSNIRQFHRTIVLNDRLGRYKNLISSGVRVGVPSTFEIYFQLGPFPWKWGSETRNTPSLVKNSTPELPGNHTMCSKHVRTRTHIVYLNTIDVTMLCLYLYALGI